jgi:hypothetical protein
MHRQIGDEARAPASDANIYRTKTIFSQRKFASWQKLSVRAFPPGTAETRRRCRPIRDAGL